MIGSRVTPAQILAAMPPGSTVPVEWVRENFVGKADPLNEDEATIQMWEDICTRDLCRPSQELRA